MEGAEVGFAAYEDDGDGRSADGADLVDPLLGGRKGMVSIGSEVCWWCTSAFEDARALA